MTRTVAKPIWGALFKAQDGSFQSRGSAANLKPYRLKFACECSWPHWKLLNSPSDFPPSLSGRGWSRSKLTTALCQWVLLLGFWLMLMWRGCLCMWAFLRHRRSAGVGFGTRRGFSAAFLEMRGVSPQLGRWDTSCLRAAWGGVHMVLMRCWQRPLAPPQHHWQTWGSSPASLPALVLFQLPPSETYVLIFAPSLPFSISNSGEKERRCEQTREGKNMLLF